MIFPKLVTHHVYDGCHLPPFDAQAYQYIIAGNGLLVRAETRFFSALLPIVACGVRGLAPYLKRLLELGLVERRVPATLPREKRQTTTRSRYHLSDPYLRFYFRFIEPNLEMIELGRADLLWTRIGEQFRAFVGMTVFEELCREWVQVMAPSALPFLPETVGSHWSTDSQVDVVAISWREKAILLGESKWGGNALNRSIVRELLQKAETVVPGDGWRVHYAFFARSGFTEAASTLAASTGALLVDLERLFHDLRAALIKQGP